MNDKNIFTEQNNNTKINISTIIIGILIIFFTIGIIISCIIINRNNREKTERLKIISKTYGYNKEKHNTDYKPYLSVTIPIFTGKSEIIETINELYEENFEKGKDICQTDGSLRNSFNHITLNHAGFLSGYSFFLAALYEDQKVEYYWTYYSFFQKEEECVDMNDPNNIFTEEGKETIFKKAKSSLKNKSHLRDIENDDIKIILYPKRICFMICHEDSILADDILNDKYLSTSTLKNIENIKVYYKYNEIDEYIKEDSPIRLLYDSNFKFKKEKRAK